jgi:hypothetical protein
MSRFVILLFLCLMLTACQTTSPTATPTIEIVVSNANATPAPSLTSFMLSVSSATPEPTPTSMATGSPPLALVTTSPIPSAELIILKTPAPLILRDYLVTTPEDWFSTFVTLVTIEGTLFVNQDPAFLQSFDDTTSIFPQDFAGGALVLSSLPPESDGNAMLAGMTEGISDFNDQDLEAMLFVADQIGLISLAAIESVNLEKATIDELAGYTALVMDGTLLFEDKEKAILRTQVWLTWTETSFIVFYQFTGVENWSTFSQAFDKTRTSIMIH